MVSKSPFSTPILMNILMVKLLFNCKNSAISSQLNAYLELFNWDKKLNNITVRIQLLAVSIQQIMKIPYMVKRVCFSRDF